MSTELERVFKAVDEVTDPEKMSREAYKEFLEELILNLEGRLEAVKEELGNG